LGFLYFVQKPHNLRFCFVHNVIVMELLLQKVLKFVVSQLLFCQFSFTEWQIKQNPAGS